MLRPAGRDRGRDQDAAPRRDRNHRAAHDVLEGRDLRSDTKVRDRPLIDLLDRAGDPGGKGCACDENADLGRGGRTASGEKPRKPAQPFEWRG
jgi:hypothetical protein